MASKYYRVVLLPNEPEVTSVAGPGVLMPTLGVEPRAVLATSLWGAPGVYAILVGSGLSSAAGIPTGWQVVQDLIRQVGRAEGADPSNIDESPEQWWADQGRPEPRYDVLVPELATTAAARQRLLARYFEPLTADAGPVPPSSAHHELAKLCAVGRVRVIVTTNFDRLIERALDIAGVTYQVVTSADAVTGMVPLHHAKVTVVKVNGDYASLGLRNTPAELSSYPKKVKNLLNEIAENFGLVCVGWSADYDPALVDAISRAKSRRYPMYWISYQGHLTAEAKRVIALREATVIDTQGADELFVDLEQRLQQLDAVALRRGKPQQVRTYSHFPEAGPLQGWSMRPLVQLRCVSALGPLTQDDVDFIRPRHRDALVERLHEFNLPAHLSAFTEMPPVASNDPDSSTSAPFPALNRWIPTPGAHQSVDHMSYRLGEEDPRGVGCIVSIAGPRFGMDAGSFVIKLDIGISVKGLIDFDDLADAIAEGLMLVTDLVPNAIGDLFPLGTGLNQAEFHVQSSENNIAKRIGMEIMGKRGGDAISNLSAAFRLNDSLDRSLIRSVVYDGLEYTLLANGYLDPSEGLRIIAKRLGI